MEKQNKSIDRIVRLDVNNFKGELEERWKAPVANKKIGLKIVERVLSLFGINLNEIKSTEQKELDEEKRLQTELSRKV